MEVVPFAADLMPSGKEGAGLKVHVVPVAVIFYPAGLHDVVMTEIVPGSVDLQPVVSCFETFCEMIFPGAVSEFFPRTASRGF